jgi:regulator of protease activity HflC (stomatin/prohibitin superfamily)
MISRFQARIEEWSKRNLPVIVGTFFLIAFLCIFFYPLMFFTIESGHAGVIFRRFFGGTVTKYVSDEGFQVIPPWDKMIIYDVRVQQVEHTFRVLSSNGLDITVTTSIRFRPRIELLGVLHKEVGPDYLDKIVLPEVQALIRQVFGQYTPEEIYTTKRSIIEQTLQEALGQIAEKYVVLDDLLLKAIILPVSIESAIEAKLVEEQRALEMKFRIDRERLEADRKVIEAQGVDMSQQIIGASLNQQLLQYKGIEATLSLATSHNSKVVMMGGNGGLPLILNTGLNDQADSFKPPFWTNVFPVPNSTNHMTGVHTNQLLDGATSRATNSPISRLSISNVIARLGLTNVLGARPLTNTYVRP